MSNPDQAATHDISDGAQAPEAGHEQPQAETFADKVNELAGQMTKNSDGTWQLPEGEYPEELKYAVTAEKRVRDAQSAYGKEKHRTVILTAERDSFKEKLHEVVPPSLTTEQADELETLKHSDPDAWRNKLNGYEKAAREDLGDVAKDAVARTEIQRRSIVLDEFKAENPGFDLVDDDIPPRLAKRLEEGKVSFEGFLNEVNGYLNSSKSTTPKIDTKQPNLGKLSGGSTPAKGEAEKDISSSYAKDDIY